MRTRLCGTLSRLLSAAGCLEAVPGASFAFGNATREAGPARGSGGALRRALVGGWGVVVRGLLRDSAESTWVGRVEVARAEGVVPALGVGQMVNGGARSLKVRTSAGFECAWGWGGA